MFSESFLSLDAALDALNGTPLATRCTLTHHLKELGLADNFNVGSLDLILLLRGIGTHPTNEMTDHRCCLVYVGRERSLIIETLSSSHGLAHSLVCLRQGLRVTIKTEDGKVKQPSAFLFL